MVFREAEFVVRRRIAANVIQLRIAMCAFQTQDDDLHSHRILRAIALYTPPLWMAFIFTGFIIGSLGWTIVALVILLPPTVYYLHRVAFTGICPRCKRHIRFSTSQDHYSAGDAYTYRCDDCNTVWRTHLRPGN